LAVDELTAGDEAVEHQSHLAARVDNNVVALPCDVNQKVIIMEVPGKQCTVVFALIVTELASECVEKGGRVFALPFTHPLASCVTIYAKTTVHCFLDSSMLTPISTELLPSNFVSSSCVLTFCHIYL
jgi:hypothetical protein